MSILINSTTLGNIIITLGSVFLLYYLIHGIKLQESLLLVKRKLPQILIVLKMLVKKQKAWHKNVKMSWQVLALRQLKLLMGPRKLVKLKNLKSLQKHMMKLNA